MLKQHSIAWSFTQAAHTDVNALCVHAHTSTVIRRLCTMILQDYKELKERHIVQGGVSPAAALLEKNLVANHLKQQVMPSRAHSLYKMLEHVLVVTLAAMAE
jgi:hypothetical protein